MRQLAEDFRAAEERLLSSNGDDESFNSFINLVEIVAAGVNDGLLIGASKKIAKQKLVSVLAFIRSRPDLRDRLRNAIDSDDTFDEIAKFAKANKAEIERLAALSAASNTGAP